MCSSVKNANHLLPVWKPATKLPEVLSALCALLENPNPDDPLRAAIAEEFNTDNAKFVKTAKEWTKKYAT